MSEWVLSQDVIYLRGEVSVKTLAGLSEQLQQLLTAQVHRLDCSGVTKVDSSIAALLLMAIKCAGARDIRLAISGLPQSVSRLIKLYDLEDVILHPSQPLKTTGGS